MSRDSRGYRDSGPLDCKVYVGDLGSSASRNEIEDEFRKYGELRNVWVARNPPGFAYVEYKDNRDAQEAVDATDGIKLCGRRIRVEMSTGQSRRGGRGGGGGGGGYGRGPPRRTDECCYECGERGHFARDCNNRSSGHSRRSYGSGSRSRYSRSRSRSRSRSYSPKRRYSRSRSRSRSRD